ncbi:hypothetical protein Tco_0153854 [Tanacetum coccineum]
MLKVGMSSGKRPKGVGGVTGTYGPEETGVGLLSNPLLLVVESPYVSQWGVLLDIGSSSFEVVTLEPQGSMTGVRLES